MALILKHGAPAGVANRNEAHVRCNLESAGPSVASRLPTTPTAVLNELGLFEGRIWNLDAMLKGGSCAHSGAQQAPDRDLGSTNTNYRTCVDSSASSLSPLTRRQLVPIDD